MFFMHSNQLYQMKEIDKKLEKWFHVQNIVLKYWKMSLLYDTLKMINWEKYSHLYLDLHINVRKTRVITQRQNLFYTLILSSE